jgi:hypothetical protein
MKSKLTEFFVREKAKSRLSKDAKDKLADFCVAAAQGAMLMGKIQRSSEVAEASMREILSHLRSSIAAR